MRTKKLIPWVIYAVCALAVLEGLGYAGYKALDLQRQRRQDEAIRLALWRMDSALTAVLAAESARPYFHYRPFHPAERAYSRMLGPVEPGEVLVPSPLLTRVPPFVRLHFEIGPDGRVTSPQAPDGNLRDLAESEYVAADDVIAAEALRLMLAELLVPRRDAGVTLSAPPESPIDADRFARQETAAAAQLAVSPQRQTQTPELDVADQVESMPEMGVQPESEENARIPAARARRAPDTKTASLQPEVVLGPLSATWLAGEELVLMRDVQIGDTRLTQGVWLDWPSLQHWLLAQVADLAPGATIRPGASASRSLAVIPAVIELPAAEGVLGELASPLGVVLVLTWTAALLAVIAIGIVLRLATSLAERRGRFVSAVTHELRTPMTSVRLYADLLASEAAQDATRRERFVGTLQEESARLARIIENVLAYARLGRPSGDVESEQRTVGDLVDRVLAEHAPAFEQAGLTIHSEVNPDVADRRIDADGDAAVRILENLVENACKYAHPHEQPVVRITAHERDGMVLLTVRDWGPGIPDREHRRIFEAFHRAPRDELRQNGLGLGLALARGLARQLGGSLELDDVSPGASFTIRLPLVR
ncbi:MAG: HAMP domain-containing sensor histidine kinase [Phycisphaerales bacterium]